MQRNMLHRVSVICDHQGAISYHDILMFLHSRSFFSLLIILPVFYKVTVMILKEQIYKFV